MLRRYFKLNQNDINDDFDDSIISKTENKPSLNPIEYTRNVLENCGEIRVKD